MNLSWGTNVILDLPQCINHSFIPLPTATISSSFHLSFILTQDFPSLEEMLSSATVLVQIAGYKASLVHPY